ncbi:hypothetical protein, partial [Methylomonas rivi]
MNIEMPLFPSFPRAAWEHSQGALRPEIAQGATGQGFLRTREYEVLVTSLLDNAIFPRSHAAR